MDLTTWAPYLVVVSASCSVSFGILDNMQVDYKEKTRDGNAWAQENYVEI